MVFSFIFISILSKLSKPKCFVHIQGAIEFSSARYTSIDLYVLCVSIGGIHAEQLLAGNRIVALSNIET